ncbi:hypothetical protein QBC35DRAFT_385935 [Podospora australis]|uniref:Zn(2)-C6 fungal-type domain-containing protein n=1 Tax=Podospora australis TaxID=1536484 RepID=A0AAN7AHP6_9PEZI|nr:hypothetical protein QBC35DRAFT_385935 [Podospora australis]
MGPPTTYKPIQPAPAKRDWSGGSSVTGSSVITGGDTNSSSSGSGSERQTKRVKAVTQACHTCRRYKARVSNGFPCDGARPRCGGCASKGKPCGYEGEEGQSRQAAMKTRLENLEKCFSGLRSTSYEEARDLFHRIREGVEELALLNASNDVVTSGADGASVVTGKSACAAAPPPPLSIAGSVSTTTQPTPSTHRESSRAASEASTPLSARSSSSLTLVQSSSPSSTRIRTETSDYLFQFVLPSAKSVSDGVQSFFGSSGKLFHVFSPEQAQEYYWTVFGLKGLPNVKERKAICCLCIIAAIGVQYNPSDFEQGADELLYNVARRFFTDVMEESPLEAIKVCTLLAMYNVMNKATAALAYIEVGLSMSKRQSENTGVAHPALLSQAEWVDFRKTWRTLMFFSSWLSSTLGYISGTDESSDAFVKLVPLAGQETDIYTVEIGELVQAEMTKISLLKAGILRTRLVKELTSSGIDGIVKELREWHGRLPPEMQLATLGDFDIPAGVRWSIYHVHLLYLGAIMLVYRRVAAQCARAYSVGDRLLLDDNNSALSSLVELGANAARDSARILGLLYADKGIFKRCWLVIFQAHTSCVVILHSIAQKQLHKFPASSWAEDMKHVQHCLDVLEFCATMDTVALRFRIRVSGIHKALCTTAAEQHTNMQRVEDWVPPPPNHSSEDDNGKLTNPATYRRPADYLLTIPPDADPDVLKISLDLMYALCRPWDEAENVKTALGPCGKNPMRKRHRAIASSNGKCGALERSQLLAQLDWGDLQTKAQPFQWDTRSIVNDPAKIAELGAKEAMFLGSEAPSGWASTPDLEVDDI